MAGLKGARGQAPGRYREGTGKVPGRNREGIGKAPGRYREGTGKVTASCGLERKGELWRDGLRGPNGHTAVWGRWDGRCVGPVCYKHVRGDARVIGLVCWRLL